MISLIELLTNKQINKSDYNAILSAIVSGKGPLPLVEYGKTNDLYNTLIKEVDDKISKLIASNTDTRTIRTAIYIGSITGITSNITTHVIFNCRKQGAIHFGILGSDLKPFIHNLPKYIDMKTRKICSPFTLSDFTKVYPVFLRKMIVSITVNLMLFEHLFETHKITVTSEYKTKIIGHLGGEVKIEIPVDQQHLLEYFADESLEHPNNPRKVTEGRFNFNKNGITHSVTNRLLLEICIYISKISIETESKIFESYITSYDISEFLQSDKDIATCGWNHHSRIIIKVDSSNIVIIDPWMKFIPRALEPELIKANPDINFTILQRTIKDQLNGEGSCVLCSMSRLLSIALEYKQTSLPLIEICNKPISDINAYLVGRMYRICTGQIT